MGGLCGILSDSSPASQRDLHAMLFMLAHRGVGAPGIWASGRVALGHWDLGTLDAERTVSQPFQNESGGLGLVFDGRLDNRLELLDALEIDPRPDAEIVLAAFARWKEDAWRHLLGDFALALWDGSKETLHLARDPVGVRPLFYTRTPTRFLFASEVKALAALHDVPRAPDAERLREFERFRFRSIEETFFKGILRVPPGHSLRAAGRKLEKHRYWYPRREPPVPVTHAEDLFAEFHSIFIESVRDRLPKAGTAAIMLSGGLDSSSIAVAASHTLQLDRRVSSTSLKAYTLLWRNGDDERVYGRLAAERAGIHVTPLYMDDVKIESALPPVFASETPLFNPIELVFAHLYRAAAAHGHRIILNGEWGDDLLHGGAFLADLLLAGRWREFWSQLKGFRDHEGVPLPSMIRNVLEFLILPRRDTPPFPHHAQEQVYESVFVPLKLMAIENMERGAAACGVELRLPFLDLRLIEFLLRTPGEWLAKEGVGKQFLRKGLADLLPPDIVRDPLKNNTPLFRVPSSHPGPEDGPALQAYLREWSRRALQEWKRTWFGWTL